MATPSTPPRPHNYPHTGLTLSKCLFKEAIFNPVPKWIVPRWSSTNMKKFPILWQQFFRARDSNIQLCLGNICRYIAVYKRCCWDVWKRRLWWDSSQLFPKIVKMVLQMWCRVCVFWVVSCVLTTYTLQVTSKTQLFSIPPRLSEVARIIRAKG